MASWSAMMINIPETGSRYMGRFFIQICAVCLIAACGACATPTKGVFPPQSGEPTKVIHLVSHGWHAGIVLRHSDIPPEHWLRSLRFQGAEYLEVGWGDKDFYQAEDPGLGIKLKALFLPTTSVLHIVGFDGALSGFFPHSEIVEITLTEDGYKRLLDYIARSHAKDTGGLAVSLGPGLYGDSRFYLSQELYHAFKTCNNWTAKGLRAAGYPITPAFTFTVSGLLSQALVHGRRIQAKSTAP